MEQQHTRTLDRTRPLRPQQLAFLEFVRELPVGTAIVDMCAAAGVPRRTFYGWLREPRFLAVYEQLWYTQTKDAMPEVTAAMIREAKRGNVRAAKLLFDAMGLIVRQSHQTQDVRVVVERTD